MQCQPRRCFGLLPDRPRSYYGRVTGWVYKGKIDGASTYETWVCDCHSMHLCSIRRTHYCSLAKNISSWVERGQGAEMRRVQCGSDERHGRRLHIQPDRHEPDPRALVGARRTVGRHTRLHEGSISVGASVDGAGGPGRRRRA
jgi:hypothetical protein